MSSAPKSQFVAFRSSSLNVLRNSSSSTRMLVEQGQNLLVDLGLGQPDARVIAQVIPGASVVDVLLVTILRLLGLRFAGDRAATVATMDEFTGVPHLVRAIDGLAK